MTNIIVFSQQLAQSLIESNDPFPVNFDQAWQWLGYATKQKAKNKLLNNFECGLDFLTKWVKSPQGGRPSEMLSLTIDCFKSLGMMAGTDQGKNIRKYFLQCENIVKTVLPEQNNRLRELELENENLKLGVRLSDSQTKLLATVQLLETVSPGLAPLALGRADAVVERIEYVERVIDKSQDKITEGVGIGYLTKRFGFKNNNQTWQFLDSIGYGKDSGKWENQLTAIETPKLPKEALNDLSLHFKKASRQLLLGE